ncbi:MAG: class I SAM-dependent methyltransferase [Symploca sp. SIO3E6]|nr:class I SAM-dependent methyltransferase [Caldora sp. SIO3E6]
MVQKETMKDLSNATSGNYWQSIAKLWDLIGSPSRPCDQDLAFIKEQSFPYLESLSPNISQAVMLGVTKEIALLSWPYNVSLLAIDRSPEMIDLVWPKTEVPKGKAILGDWKNLPCPDNSCDLVVGDCCFTLLDYPQSYQTVLQEVSRILKPQGLFIMRFFLRPDLSEDIETIFDELKAKAIGNIFVFRWRLAMALQNSPEEGLPVHKIWQRWQQEVSNPDQLMEHLGWPTELLATITNYQNSSAVFTFPTLSEVRQIFLSYFDEVSCHFPSYELGERCPTLTFHPKK